jgi:hypothetical protein
MFLLSALCKGVTSIGLRLIKVILSQSKVQMHKSFRSKNLQFLYAFHIINSAVNLSLVSLIWFNVYKVENWLIVLPLR